MQLTLYTDYSLRTLMFLGMHPGEIIPVHRIAESFGVSVNHMQKVAKDLTNRGLVKATRGRTGGLELNCDPAKVKLGDFVQQTEPHMDLLECFNAESNTCPIAGPCRLERMLREAQKAFIASLDRYTLADVLKNHKALAKRLS